MIKCFRLLNEKLIEVESKSQQLIRQEERIEELENEVNIYTENHRLMTDELRESEMRKKELESQVSSTTYVFPSSRA